MYRPNFCAECGAKVRCTGWRLWTSRSFCADCARIFRRGHILRTLTACVALFVVGLAAGRLSRPAQPPLVVERAQMSPIAPTKTEAQEDVAIAASSDTTSSPAPKPEPSYGPDGTATERPTDPNEVVSICGARTQKGSPCQRRVRGTGRCWQHKGMPALLPPSKLIIPG